MVVYCACPIRGDKKYQKSCIEIIDHIKSLGHTALSEVNEEFKSSMPLTDKQLFKRDIKWLERSKLLIAETSGGSTGVGFEVAYTLYSLKKPVLALAAANSDGVSAMISGCNSDLLTLAKYSNAEELKDIITKFLEKIGED